MGGKGSGRKKTPPRSNIDPKTLTEEELTALCFGKPLAERIWKEKKLRRKGKGRSKKDRATKKRQYVPLRTREKRKSYHRV
jgi:hypothetical protein